ncbi:drug resistance transporter, EmrB/QacA subfamily [Klenkia marina]|uniref:Drug resistance transporter, EmrB/QacA subfamily n=1 Tax=Klenkia marina TaxID=1960309 RepID=A0A1G4YL29_9ACTN|nr:MFS transporter [Klenkia marina]SCX54153.1 drug resistance transporter, EmrB/QacA subfamily [Klenkia marina]
MTGRPESVTQDAAPQSRDRSGLVLGVLSLAAFMAALDLFIVNVAFRDIGRSFPEESLSDQSWVLNAYAVVYAALLVPLGRYADQRSRKTGFIAGLVVFTVASLACALAPNLWFLVAARAVQAVGAAALTPTSLGLIVQTFSGPARTRAVRIWAATGAIAAAAGPVIGGSLVELSWRWVFLINIPTGILAVIVAVKVLRDGRDTSGTRAPGPLGAFFVILAVGALALALVQGNDWGWGNPKTVTAFALAAAGSAALALQIARSSRPLVDLALLQVRTFRWSNLSVIGFGAAFAGFLLAGVLWAQLVWGYSDIKVGLCVAPGPLMVPVFAVLAQRAARRVSSSAITVTGCLLFAAGCVLVLTSVTVDGAYATQLLPALLITGAGTGLALPELLATATSELPPERSTTGSAIVNTSRQIGAVVGVSLVIAYLPDFSGIEDPVPGFQHAWWACAITAVLGAGAAMFMRPDRGVSKA